MSVRIMPVFFCEEKKYIIGNAILCIRCAYVPLILIENSEKDLALFSSPICTQMSHRPMQTVIDLRSIRCCSHVWIRMRLVIVVVVILFEGMFEQNRLFCIRKKIDDWKDD